MKVLVTGGAGNGISVLELVNAFNIAKNKPIVSAALQAAIKG